MLISLHLFCAPSFFLVLVFFSMLSPPSYPATPSSLPPFSNFVTNHFVQPSPFVSPINKKTEYAYITREGHAVLLSNPLTFMFPSRYPDCPFNRLAVMIT